MFTFYGLAIASFWECLFNWTSLLQYVKKLFISCNDSHLLSYLPFNFSACQSKDKILQILLVFLLYPAMMADND